MLRKVFGLSILVFFIFSFAILIQDCRGTIDATAGWKTYKNEQYGFEIKYPHNKNYGVIQSTLYETNSKASFIIEDPAVPCYGITVREISSLEGLKSLWEKELRATAVSANVIVRPIWKDVAVAGKKAIEMSYEQFVGGYTGMTHRIGLMKNSSEAYDIFLINGEEKEFYQILSTFKLTK